MRATAKLLCVSISLTGGSFKVASDPERAVSLSVMISFNFFLKVIQNSVFVHILSLPHCSESSGSFYS